MRFTCEMLMILIMDILLLNSIEQISSKITFVYLNSKIIFFFHIAAYLEPLIRPLSDDVTHFPGENVKFTCESDEAIHWRFAWYPYLNEHQPLLHENTIENMKKYNYAFSTLNNERNENTYKIQLILFNVSHASVGYYFCVKNASEQFSNYETLMSSSMISKIYLFVKGNIENIVFIQELFY